MNETFVKFHKLPAELKAQVTSADAMAMLESLEQKYDVALADTIIRLMVHELAYAQLPEYVRGTLQLSGGKADALLQELRQGLLKPVLPYLEGRAATSNIQLPPLPSAQKKAEPRTAPPPPALPTADQRPPKPITPMPTLTVLPAMATIPRRAVQAPAQLPVADRQPPMSRPSVSAPVPERQGILKKIEPSVERAPSQKSAPDVQKQKLPQGARAEYFVDAEDEEEIRHYQNRLAELESSSQDPAFAPQIGTLAKRFKVDVADAVLQKRFNALVLSRLREVRDALALKDLLMRSTKIGGMGYDEKTADLIVASTEEILQAFHARALGAAAQVPTTNTQPPTTKEPAEERTPMAPDAQAPVMPLPPPIPEPHIPIAPPVPTRPVPVEAAVPVDTTTRIVPPRPQQSPSMDMLGRERSNFGVRRPDVLTSDRQMVQDVKRPPRPMAPSDELGEIGVEDFRQPGLGPNGATAKILEKINLLTEESFEKRAEGIASWRKSPLYQTYLSLGRESMMTGKTIDEIGEMRRQKGQPSLSNEEFSMIADLNRQLTL